VSRLHQVLCLQACFQFGSVPPEGDRTRRLQDLKKFQIIICSVDTKSATLMLPVTRCHATSASMHVYTAQQHRLSLQGVINSLLHQFNPLACSTVVTAGLSTAHTLQLCHISFAPTQGISSYKFQLQRYAFLEFRLREVCCTNASPEHLETGPPRSFCTKSL
jgi:hypothetical protein